MKPFQLDTILNYRKRLEDIAKNRLVDTKRQQQSVRQKLDKSNNNLAALIGKKERLQEDTISISDLIDYENRILYCKKSIEGIEKKLAEIDKTTQKQQLDLIEKSRNRQIMEKLKDQQDTKWLHYLDKKETRQLDEIATIRHNRRS